MSERDVIRVLEPQSTPDAAAPSGEAYQFDAELK
jgi:hypothetical protein